MSDLQEVASHLVIVGHGKVIADSCVADLIASLSADRVTVRTGADWDAMSSCRSPGRRWPMKVAVSSPSPGRSSPPGAVEYRADMFDGGDA
jgi:hypothetical protein